MEDVTDIELHRLKVQVNKADPKSKSRLQKFEQARTTKHPGSKKPRNKKNRRAVAKRARQSRRANR